VERFFQEPRLLKKKHGDFNRSETIQEDEGQINLSVIPKGVKGIPKRRGQPFGCPLFASETLTPVIDRGKSAV
jgi:hypothetical protein